MDTKSNEKILNLRVERLWLNDDYTIGRMFINDRYFCNTLEDKVRDLAKEKKVPEHTAIPYGKYKVVITYSAKFKKDLPLLIDVPCFEGIRIHAGNTADDSAGCILLGENKVKGKVLNSRYYVNQLIERIKNFKGEVYIEII